MTEEVGGIVYEVGMDVKGLKAGATTANKTLDDLESSTNKTTSALGKLDKNARNAGSGMKNAGGAASGPACAGQYPRLSRRVLRKCAQGY